MKVGIVGGHGKSGLAVARSLTARGVGSIALGRADQPDLAGLAGCAAAYLVAPNFHPDEPAYVAAALDACERHGVRRVVYHSVASPHLPAMPHHLGKARSEDLVRRSGLAWTILQPAVYVQNFDLGGPLEVPYDVHARFGFLDLADLGEAAATVLVEQRHQGATYELASRQSSVAELAEEAGTTARRVEVGADVRAGLRTMFAYYDEHGLPAGTLVLRALLGRP
ncbi:MAG: NAD(P)H-binding protein [Nocardioides sp.]